MDSRLRGNGTRVRSRLLRRFLGDRVLSQTRTTNRIVACKLQTMPAICNSFATRVGRVDVCRPFRNGRYAALLEATCVVCCCDGGLKGHSPHPEMCDLAERRARVSPAWAQPASVGSVIPDGVLPAHFCPLRISFIFRNESRPSCDDSSRDKVP